MRVKVGTSLEEDLLRRLQANAGLQSKPLNEILEEAIRQYLARQEGADCSELIDRTYGSLRVTPKQVRQVLDEDLHEP